MNLITYAKKQKKFVVCVSRGTDPSQANHDPAIILGHQALKNLRSPPPPPRQTKRLDNSNILHMFNNNTYMHSDLFLVF